MTAEGRFAFPGLNRLLHEPARLSVMTALMAQPDGILFPDLKVLCDLTDGNLNRHLAALREAGCIELWKRGAGRNRKTLIKATASGRKQFLLYLEKLETVVRDAGAAAQRSAGKSSQSSLGLASDSPLN